jgi:hypothetical protein
MCTLKKWFYNVMHSKSEFHLDPIWEMIEASGTGGVLSTSICQRQVTKLSDLTTTDAFHLDL